jgi:hypothetical protein
MTKTWFDIEKANLRENNELINVFEDEHIRAYQLSIIYEFYEARNSYNGYKSKTAMFDNFGFHFDFNTIKQRIELNRKKGSYFEIHEVPCIAVKGETKALILFPKDSEHRFPFKKLTASLSEKVIKFDRVTNTLKSFYESLKISKINQLNVFVIDIENIIPFEKPLKSYRSVSEGSDYYNSFQRWSNSDYIEHTDYLIDAFKLI